MSTRIRSATMLIGMLAIGATVAFSTLRTRGQAEPSAPPNGGGTMPAVFAPTPPPLTKLEKLSAQSGIVVLKGYTVIGDLAGDDGSNLRVTVVRFADAASPATGQSGIVVQVREGGNNRETLSYVDTDELGGLIDAVQTLGHLQPGDVPLQEYEARYATHGDLELANVDVGGGRMIGIRGVQYFPLTGQIMTALAQFRVSRTNELGQLLGNARKTIDGLKGK